MENKITRTYKQKIGEANHKAYTIYRKEKRINTSLQIACCQPTNARIFFPPLVISSSVRNVTCFCLFPPTFSMFYASCPSNILYYVKILMIVYLGNNLYSIWKFFIFVCNKSNVIWKTKCVSKFKLAKY